MYQQNPPWRAPQHSRRAGQPRQPGYGHPQHPGREAPGPRPGQRERGRAIGILAAVFLGLIVAGAITSGGLWDIGNHPSAPVSGDSGDRAGTPHYEIVEQDGSGGVRKVTIEVDSTKNLKRVFDAVTEDLTVEAGYWVEINCSTGGTKSAENHLANGQYAVGDVGAAVTGLDNGGFRFSTTSNRTCPQA